MNPFPSTFVYLRKCWCDFTFIWLLFTIDDCLYGTLLPKEEQVFSCCCLSPLLLRCVLDSLKLLCGKWQQINSVTVAVGLSCILCLFDSLSYLLFLWLSLRLCTRIEVLLLTASASASVSVWVFSYLIVIIGSQFKNCMWVSLTSFDDVITLQRNDSATSAWHFTEESLTWAQKLVSMRWDRGSNVLPE